MAKLEEEVTGFFKMWPSSVFVSELPSSFDRLLMHALCQYLDLKSRSKNFCLVTYQLTHNGHLAGVGDGSGTKTNLLFKM